MSFKKLSAYVLLAYTAVTVAVIVAQEFGGGREGDRAFDDGDYLLVTYFHSYKRCATCLDMERFTREAVAAVNGAATAASACRDAGGAPPVVRMRKLNWQDPANKGLVERYALLGNAVVLSEVRAGRETRFKILDRTWDLAHDRDAYVEYVRSEIESFRKGGKDGRDG